MKKTGYKEMLRDRITIMQAVDLALKWCNAKTRWIDHVYNNFIGIYKSNEERNKATRIVLGLKDGKPSHFDFHRSIDWDNVGPRDKEYWENIEQWVVWFQDNLAYIEQYIKLRYDDAYIEQHFNITDQHGLVEYIRKSI